MQNIKEQKQWVIICHLSALCGFLFPLANLVLPFIIMLLQKDKMPLVKQEGEKIINAQISYTVYGLCLFCLNFLLFAIAPVLMVVTITLQFAFGALWIGLILFAAVQTYKDKQFEYPFVKIKLF